MNINDKQHIEAICRRHNIMLLDKLQAAMLACARGRMDAVADGNSYSVNVIDNDTGKTAFRGIYVSSDYEGSDPYGIECSTPESADEQEYFVALHELAHNILNHDNNGATVEQEIAHEIEAWEWAFSHAQYWPGDETIVNSLLATSTYTHLPDFRERQQEAA